MEIARYWRIRQERYCLKGEICTRCNKKIFPPKGVCPYCENLVAYRYSFDSESEQNTQQSTPINKNEIDTDRI